MKKLFLLFSIANTILLLFPMALMAQQTHVLEPSIMEVAYHEISGKYNDDTMKYPANTMMTTRCVWENQ